LKAKRDPVNNYDFEELYSWGQDQTPPKTRLLDQVRAACRLKHYSPRTEQAYILWIRQFILHNQKKHPAIMGQSEIESYLNHLAIKRHVSASTQSTALNAIAFLYTEVLNMEMPCLEKLKRIKRHHYIPVVLSIGEVQSILGNMQGTMRLMAELIYGTGLRIGECVKLRIKDVDFDNNQITVRAGKGYKDRVTLLPATIVPSLRTHITKVAQLHKTDLLKGNGLAPMPNALYKKYPLASSTVAWQYVFPSSLVRPWRDTDKQVRWHCSPSTLRKAFKRAVLKANIHKHVNVHTLRHSFASHLLEAGTDIRTIQSLLGHKHLQTTMMYTHIKPDYKNVSSPLDRLKSDK